MTTESQPDTDRRSRQRPDNDETHHHDAIFTFARACEIHDQDTGDHLIRIRCIVSTIAANLGLSDVESKDLGYDAMLHDVGKLHIPASILQKTGPLTDDERARLESHTVEGEQILRARPSMERAARIARQHHESWDGSGYPDGLTGDEIALEARIVAAADILDALLAPRSYKEAWPYDTALKHVLELAGSKLDPEVADALRRAHENDALHAAIEAGIAQTDH